MPSIGLLNEDAEGAKKRKRAAIGQALMQAGAASFQAPGGIGNAIGQSIQTGLGSLRQSSADNFNQQLAAARLAQNFAPTSDMRSFSELTRGLNPADKQRAARIRLGLEGRASSAGYGFDQIVGPDGVARQVRNSLRDG